MRKLLPFLVISMTINLVWSCTCEFWRSLAPSNKILPMSITAVNIESSTASLTWIGIEGASEYQVDVKYQGTQFGEVSHWSDPKCQIKLSHPGTYEINIKAMNDKKSVIAEKSISFDYKSNQQSEPEGQSGISANPSQSAAMKSPTVKSPTKGQPKPVGPNSKGPSVPIDPWKDDPPRTEGKPLNVKLQGVVGGVARFTWDGLQKAYMQKIVVKHNGKNYITERTSGETSSYEFVVEKPDRYDIKVQAFRKLDIWDVFLGEGISYVDTAHATDKQFVFPSGKPSFNVESVFGHIVELDANVKPKFRWKATEATSDHWNVKIVHDRKKVIAVYPRQTFAEIERELKKPGRYDFLVMIMNDNALVAWGGTYVFVPATKATIKLIAFEASDKRIGDWSFKWDKVSNEDHYNVDVKYKRGNVHQYTIGDLKASLVKLQNIDRSQDKIVVAAVDKDENNLIAWGRQDVFSAEVDT